MLEEAAFQKKRNCMKRSKNKTNFLCCLTVHCKFQFEFFFCLSLLLGVIPHMVFIMRLKYTLQLYQIFGTNRIRLSLPSTLLPTHHQNRNLIIFWIVITVKSGLKGQWKGTYRCRVCVSMSHFHRKSGLKKWKIYKENKLHFAQNSTLQRLVNIKSYLSLLVFSLGVVIPQRCSEVTVFTFINTSSPLVPYL